MSTIIVGCETVGQLEENVRITQEFTPLSGVQLAALGARTEAIKRQALFFRTWQA